VLFRDPVPSFFMWSNSFFASVRLDTYGRRAYGEGFCQQPSLLTPSAPDAPRIPPRCFSFVFSFAPASFTRPSMTFGELFLFLPRKLFPLDLNAFFWDSALSIFEDCSHCIPCPLLLRGGDRDRLLRRPSTYRQEYFFASLFWLPHFHLGPKLAIFSRSR